MLFQNVKRFTNDCFADAFLLDDPLRKGKSICTKVIRNKSVIVYGAIVGESFKSRSPRVKDISNCIPTNSSYYLDERNCLQLCYVVLHHRFDNM